MRIMLEKNSVNRTYLVLSLPLALVEEAIVKMAAG